MKMQIDKEQFGPWALITGGSSGIGREFDSEGSRKVSVISWPSGRIESK